ncbi:MAG TPA: DEAD/DEAH box helicase [Acidimicrobiales bacterium]|nr:DEAD/DEAH box helicase [Acidimicrobiales bacterium]
MSITFAELGVAEDLVRGLHTRGIDHAFPIQSATLVDALAGHDVCGRAPTGSGKTLAFGIPVVTRVGHASSRRPKALILAPTRELAGQICEELTQLGSLRDCRVASFYGGVGFGPQLDALRRGVDVAVACPGRLADLIDRGALRLNEVEIVVVDEADRMADMGFMPIVRELLDQVSANRQTLLFSATLDGDVKELIRRYQNNPKRYEIDSPEDAIGESATHFFWRTDPTERVALATRIVSVHKAVMVFCRTKRGVDRLVKHLKMSGLDVGAIHGDRSQAQRDQALEAFRSQRLQVLVGTDVAARGIHVDGVDCVVHFDPPEDEKAYVHRSGRTGRAGAGGTVVSLVTREHQGFIKRLQSRLELGASIEEPDEQILTAEPIYVKNTTRPHTPPRGPAGSRNDRTARPRRDRPDRARTGRPARVVGDRNDWSPENRMARDGRPVRSGPNRAPRHSDPRSSRPATGNVARFTEGRPENGNDRRPQGERSERSTRVGSDWAPRTGGSSQSRNVGSGRTNPSRDGRPTKSSAARSHSTAGSRTQRPFSGAKSRDARRAAR